MYTSYNQGVCNNLMVSSVHLLHIHYVNLLDDVINASKQQSSIWPDQVNNVPTHYAVSMHTDLVVSSIHLHIMQSVCTTALPSSSLSHIPLSIYGFSSFATSRQCSTVYGKVERYNLKYHSVKFRHLKERWSVLMRSRQPKILNATAE